MRFKAVVFTFVFTILFMSVLSSSASPALVRETCSCEAPDGSCSASVSCRGGCSRFCGNDDNCYAYCSGAILLLSKEVSFEEQNSNYGQLVAELARISGKEIAFSARKPTEVFNVGFKKAPLWDALELLSDHGTVIVSGQDFEKLKKLRRILLTDEKITYGVKNTPVSTVVNELRTLTGVPLIITSGNPMATVNLQLPDATLKDIIANVSEQTGTKIGEAGAYTSGR